MCLTDFVNIFATLYEHGCTCWILSGSEISFLGWCDVRHEIDDPWFPCAAGIDIPITQCFVETCWGHSLFVHFDADDFDAHGSAGADGAGIRELLHHEIISSFDQHAQTGMERIRIPAGQSRRPVFVRRIMNHLSMLFEERHEMWISRPETVLQGIR